MMIFVFYRTQNIMGKKQNHHPPTFPTSPEHFQKLFSYRVVNPLLDMPISGSSNSVANKDMMSKILTKWGNNYLIR